MTGKIFYFDMDGVLANFDKEISLHGENFSDDERWEIIKKEGHRFWWLMPPIDEGIKIWNFLSRERRIILSAHPNPKRGLDVVHSAISGKRLWLNFNLGEEYSDTAVFTFRANKKFFATFNSVLIDDDENNINEFNSYGGTGILFKGQSIDVINKLKDLFKL